MDRGAFFPVDFFLRQLVASTQIQKSHDHSIYAIVMSPFRKLQHFLKQLTSILLSHRQPHTTALDHTRSSVGAGHFVTIWLERYNRKLVKFQVLYKRLPARLVLNDDPIGLKALEFRKRGTS